MTEVTKICLDGFCEPIEVHDEAYYAKHEQGFSQFSSINWREAVANMTQEDRLRYLREMRAQPVVTKEQIKASPKLVSDHGGRFNVVL